MKNKKWSEIVKILKEYGHVFGNPMGGYMRLNMLLEWIARERSGEEAIQLKLGGLR